MPRQVPDSQPGESQRGESQRNEYTYEATQLSQPRFETQNTQNINSQVEPRRKYCELVLGLGSLGAVLIPTNPDHSILKIPWARPFLQIGRGAHHLAGNDIVLDEKRVSNKHCRITLGLQGENGSGTSHSMVQSWKEGEAEPDVWIEDLGSSNGSFVNGERVKPRRLLQHGDEISLGHAATIDNHDVRYIYRSVGRRGARSGKAAGLEVVGEVYDRYQILDR